MKANLPSAAKIGLRAALKPTAPIAQPSTAPKQPDVQPAAKPLVSTVDGGVTSVSAQGTRVVDGKTLPAVSPIPVHKLAGLVAPTKATIFSENSELAARFNLLASQLEEESGCKSGTWTRSLMMIHQKVKSDPDIATALSSEALALYFRACSKLANTSAGVALTKRLAARRQEESIAKQQSLLLDAARRAAELDDFTDLDF